MIKNLIFDFGHVLVDYDYMVIIDQFFDNNEKKADFCCKILTPEWSYFLDEEIIALMTCQA